MLIELAIENFAIIDQLRIRFEPGFTVLTGETGAGKSIIIDALQAALGARMGADVVRSDAKSAVVEAIFELPEIDDDALFDLLATYGVQGDGCLILRREVQAGGRSTARLNGRAVPMGTLASLSSYLIDIHGQSEHLSVLRRDRQLEVLDRYGSLLEARAETGAAIREFMRLRQELVDVLEGRRAAEHRLDLLRFQVDEIEGAQLRPGEEEELSRERSVLGNAERLAQDAAVVFDQLQGEREGVLDVVRSAAARLSDAATLDPALQPLGERLTSVQYELEDIAQETRGYRDSTEFDPSRLEEIEERLDLIIRLKRKYGASVDEILGFGQNARAEIDLVENVEERIAALERAVRTAEQTASTRAGELSEARRTAAGRLLDAMHIALQGLGLQGTDFSAELTQKASDSGLMCGDSRYAYTANGIDTVTFLVSFNPGEPLRPLDRVASGGETSRFLLALKSVLAYADRVPTLIFDEVDVGVGARRATDVGERMRDLARAHQVISITHMPQVAALADHHLVADKAVRAGRTTVDVRELEARERVNEIAEMMSGAGTEASRRSAEEMLAAARQE